MKNFVKTMTILMALLSAVEVYAYQYEGRMVADRFGAETKYKLDSEAGFIGFYTKANVLFCNVDDTRRFFVEPSFLESATFRGFVVGETYSLDIRTDTPRYTAKLIALSEAEAKLEVRDANKVLDIDLVVNLEEEYVDFTSGVIFLRKVANMTLNMHQPE